MVTFSALPKHEINHCTKHNPSRIVDVLNRYIKLDVFYRYILSLAAWLYQAESVEWCIISGRITFEVKCSTAKIIEVKCSLKRLILKAADVKSAAKLIMKCSEIMEYSIGQKYA